MTQRAFITLLILLAVAVALSATAFPGSMIGFLFAITGVFFVAIPGAAIGDALKQGGIPVTGEQLLWVLWPASMPCSLLAPPCRHGYGSGEVISMEPDRQGCAWHSCWRCR